LEPEAGISIDVLNAVPESLLADANGVFDVADHEVLLTPKLELVEAHFVPYIKRYASAVPEFESITEFTVGMLVAGLRVPKSIAFGLRFILHTLTGLNFICVMFPAIM
jgi:hypothetical protein